MTSWICQWKPFWIPVGDSFQKVYLEEWVRVAAAPSEEPRVMSSLRLLGCRNLLLRYRGNQLIPWERRILRHHCLRCGHVPNVILVIRNALSYPIRARIHEELASSGSDHFTMWGKMSPHEILAEHVVDIHKVEADFRDSFERNQSSSSQTYDVNKYFSYQSPVQKRLSNNNWNPGRRRGKEDAFEKQIAWKWLFVTLQEASDSLEHDTLHERFHVTHKSRLRYSLQQGHLLP